MFFELSALPRSPTATFNDAHPYGRNPVMSLPILPTNKICTLLLHAMMTAHSFTVHGNIETSHPEPWLAIMDEVKSTYAPPMCLRIDWRSGCLAADPRTRVHAGRPMRSRLLVATTSGRKPVSNMVDTKRQTSVRSMMSSGHKSLSHEAQELLNFQGHAVSQRAMCDLLAAEVYYEYFRKKITRHHWGGAEPSSLPLLFQQAKTATATHRFSRHKPGG